MKHKYLGCVVDDTSVGFATLGDWFVFVSWVKDKFAKIVGESGFVGVESFLTSILSSVINRDSDGFGELCSQTDRLNFGEGESSSKSGSVTVPDGLASDGWSKSIERSGCE